jgi:GNAT superfamily N-acetyltransferase
MGKLYFHYKNKPYKYLGTVKHSETLEDLALYETLYQNDLGKLWVRPKDMFFEDVEVNGVKQKRFAPVEIEIESRPHFGLHEIEILRGLHQKLFNKDFVTYSAKHLNRHTVFNTSIARIRGEVVGYKIGFDRSAKLFYSWIGGVDQRWRGVGVASALMQAQHDWCRKNGFSEVETFTFNHYSEMIALNLRLGFQIVGTLTNDEGKPKLILRKKL